MLLTRLRKNVWVNIKLVKVQSLWNIQVLVNFNLKAVMSKDYLTISI